jgi:ABC-type transport system involved in multi-copper enzyme maturation permease subunit
VSVSAAILEKDLTLRLRGWRWAGVTTLYAGTMAVVALTFLLHQYSLVASQSSPAGTHLFQALALTELLLIVFVTPATLSGAISGERQHGTWDLLVASPASVESIVWGKLLAGIAFNLVLLVATLPVFALVFLFGGMTVAGMVPAFLVFLVTIVFLASASLLVSALTARLTVSYMAGMLVALVLVIGLSILTVYLEAANQLSPISLGSLPFLSGGAQAPLTPLAQADPLIALLSAVPSDSGGTVLGSLGKIHHAFGLPWTLRLWQAYLALGLIISALLALAAARLAGAAVRPRLVPLAARVGGRG